MSGVAARRLAVAARRLASPPVAGEATPKAAGTIADTVERNKVSKQVARKQQNMETILQFAVQQFPRSGQNQLKFETA